ncbi:peptidase S9 prolyl oligopeptidase active site domain protein [mine drainage metagenome]|uniref:Peptidase S9 prolyl oligopeptidase active site domain protein n=3 Tax=mine drainage metagenome TaxID=410659 RepID=T1BCZ5_9ZZZZ
MKRFSAYGPAILLALTPLFGHAAMRPIHLKDFRSLVKFASLEFSPGGGRIVFVAIRPDLVHNRYDRTLMVVSTSGGAPRALVRGMRHLKMPRWSPDGSQIAFIASVDRQKPEIYSVSALGGTPHRMSNAPQGVQQFAWSPNGRTIAYVTPDGPKLGKWARLTHHDLFSIHDDDYQITKAPVPSHIWLLSVRHGTARQLTFGPTSVLENAPPFAGSITAPAWSADGHWLVFTRQIDADDSDTDRTTIVAVNVKTGKVRVLTSHPTYEYTPAFAPKGDAIAYLYPHGPGPVSDMDIFVTSLAGGNGHDVSADLDRDVATTYAWLPDARGLVAVANDHVGTKIFVQPLHGRGYPLVLGRLNPTRVAVSAQGKLAFVADGARRPPELYLMHSLTSRPVALTALNRAFAAYAYPHSIEVTWRAPDGQFNDGILTYPNDYRPGRRYPLVVFSHGGPEAASTEHFDAGEIGPLRDLFAGRGYLVFEPNYRGSDNLGNAHEHAIYRDPGAGPDSDVISGIRMLEARGLVDRSRIAAVGHSYGGYMTAWLISHQHFWRCAVVADGAVDWTEEYELSGAGNLAWTRDSLGGSPWNPRSAALYRTGSPITYAGQITTPTLILSGTSDITVPITESFALYHALASRHVPVRFLGIPGAYHTPQDPVQLELFYRAIYDWVVSYMQPSSRHG